MPGCRCDCVSPCPRTVHDDGRVRCHHTSGEKRVSARGASCQGGVSRNSVLTCQNAQVTLGLPGGFRRVLFPPSFQVSGEVSREAKVLNALLVTAAICLPLVFFGNAMFGGPPALLALDVVFFLVAVLLKVRLHRGHTSEVSCAIVASGIALAALGIAAQGTIKTQTGSLFVLVTALAGLTLRLRGLVVTGAVSSITLLALHGASLRGLLPTPDPSPTLASWVTLSAVLAATGVAFHLSRCQTVEALGEARRELEERRRVEEALRESERKTRALLNAIPDTILEILRDGTVIDAAPLHPSLPFPEGTPIVGRLLTDLVSPELAWCHLSAMSETFRTAEPVSRLCAVEGPSGRRFFEARHVRSGDDSALVIVRDVTEVRRVEADREALIRELEEKNAELERFAYTISHDLTTPLVTIRGFLGYLENDAREGRVDRVSRDVARIVRATERMHQLLSDLLALSRVGRVSHPPVSLPFAEIVSDALALVEGRLVAGSIEVAVDGDLPVVWGDRTRLLELVQNLLDNAAKFVGDQPSPRVRVGTRQEGDETVFVVADNGVGLEPAHREAIFGLFAKLDPHTEGSGVGLALARRIVETHGGRLWAESEGPGHGTTFCFTLSAKPASE